MAHVELHDIVTDADREAVLALQRAPGPGPASGRDQL